METYLLQNNIIIKELEYIFKIRYIATFSLNLFLLL